MNSLNLDIYTASDNNNTGEKIDHTHTHTHTHILQLSNKQIYHKHTHTCTCMMGSIWHGRDYSELAPSFTMHLKDKTTWKDKK